MWTVDRPRSSSYVCILNWGKRYSIHLRKAGLCRPRFIALYFYLVFFFHLSLFLSFLLYTMYISNFICLYLYFFSPSSYSFFYILCPFLISSISTYLSSFFIPFLSSILCLVLFLSISNFLIYSFPIFYFIPISIFIYLYNLRDAQCHSFRHQKRIQNSASIRHCVPLSLCLLLC